MVQPASTGRPLPTVSVIVPTYRRPAMLPAVLGPLLDDPATTELIGVVDGGGEASMEVLRRMAGEDPRVVPVAIEHGGQHAACDAGVARARGDVVLLVDDDVIADPGMVTGHARHHQQRPHLVVVGYMPLELPARRGPGDGPAVLYAGEYEGLCRDVEADPDLLLRSLWFGNVSMRRDDCLAVGLLSPEFPAIYHQDQDFGIRCLRAGMTGVFDRSLSSRHIHHRSIEQFLRDSRSQGAGQWLLHQVHADLLGPFRLDRYEAGVPAPARWALRRARRPSRSERRARTMALAARAAGAARVFPVETAALKLARRFEQQAGALAAERDRSAIDRLSR